MKRKNIDTMREVRLWIGQIIVPGMITLGAVMQIPGVKESAGEAFQAVRNKIKRGSQK